MLKKRLSYLLIFTVLAFSTSSDSFNDKIIRKANKILGTPQQKKIKPQFKDPEKQRHLISLGSDLFSDPILSLNNNVSCATCHNPNKNFSSSNQFDVGTNGDTLGRHTPHLVNMNWGRLFFWDGRASSLENQFKKVLTNPKEMAMSFDTLIVRLNQSEKYNKAFATLFGENEINTKSITKAIVEFEKSLNLTNTAFDKFLTGDTTSLSKNEIKGLDIFLNKGRCVQCHKGPNFSDNDFHNTGVITDDIGRYEFDRVSVKREFEMRPYPFFATYKAFKTPNLRGIGSTAPFFHDGSKKSLREVVDFYNKGGENPDKKGLAKEIKPLNLTEDEKVNLINFLKALN
tara:strand:- start:47 stop:1075 length:1029 start_codon:yes stop_codon:yes gene_type:complete